MLISQRVAAACQLGKSQSRASLGTTCRLTGPGAQANPGLSSALRAAAATGRDGWRHSGPLGEEESGRGREGSQARAGPGPGRVHSVSMTRTSIAQPPLRS